MRAFVMLDLSEGDDEQLREIKTLKEIGKRQDEQENTIM